MLFRKKNSHTVVSNLITLLSGTTYTDILTGKQVNITNDVLLTKDCRWLLLFAPKSILNPTINSIFVCDVDRAEIYCTGMVHLYHYPITELVHLTSSGSYSQHGGGVQLSQPSKVVEICTIQESALDDFCREHYVPAVQDIDIVRKYVAGEDVTDCEFVTNWEQVKYTTEQFINLLEPLS